MTRQPEPDLSCIPLNDVLRLLKRRKSETQSGSRWLEKQEKNGKLKVIRGYKGRNGKPILMGLAPSELERFCPVAFHAWLREQQPAQLTEERQPRADLVELGDDLAELVERCARLKAVAGREKRAVRLVLAQEWGISEATINRRISAAQKGPAALKRRERADKGKVRGPADLVPRYRKEKLQEWILLIDAYVRLQLLDGRALSLSRRLKDARKECLRLDIDPAVINYSRVRRIRKRIDPGTLAYHGPRDQEYTDGFQPHVLVEKPREPHILWSADHFKFDNLILNPAKRDLRGRIVGGADRPWLTAIRDEASNYLVGWHVSWQGSSETIALALHHALSRFSPPKWLKIDNGKDFISSRIEAACMANDIQTIRCEPEHGQGKGIERSFRDNAHDHCRQFDDYIGNAPAARPDKVKVTRTRDQFIRDFSEWLNEAHSTPSTALRGKSPNQVLQSHYQRGSVERPLEAGALRVLLMKSKPRQVRQFGIQLWCINGDPLYYRHPELDKIIGAKVECFWHPDQVGEVHIYRQEGERKKFVCSAVNEPLMKIGATEEDLRRAVYLPRKQAREFHKSVKAEAEHKYRSGLELIGDAARVRLDLPEPEELALAVGQSIPRINQWSHMAREQSDAKRNGPACVQVDPERALEELAQQRQSQDLAEIDRQYEKAQRKLTLLD